MQRIRDYRVLIPKERQKDSKSQWWGMRGGSGGGGGIGEELGVYDQSRLPE